MIFSLYSIQDGLTGFSSPTPHNNDAAAMRAFAEAFKDVYQPQDYSLWCIGQYNTDTGEIIPDVPVIVCRATDFVKGEDYGKE